MDQLRRLNDNLENEKNQISAISRNVNFLLKNPFFIETKNRQSNNGKGVIFKKKRKCIQNSENMNNFLKNSPTTFNDTRKKKIDVEQIEDAPSNFNSMHGTVYENEDINQTVSYITELQLKNHLEFLGEIDANPRNEISNKDIKTQTLPACRKAATETDVRGRKPSLSECSKPAVRRAKNSNIQSKARLTHDLLVKDAEAKCKCETEKNIRSVKDCSGRTSSETKHFNDVIVKCNTIHKVKASSQIEEDGSVDDETLQPVELLVPVTSDIKQTPDFSNNGHLFKKHSPCKHATQRNEALRSQLFQAELVTNSECFMKRKFMDVLQSHSVHLVPHLMRSSLASPIKKKLYLLWLYECIILLLASENRSERCMHLNKLFLKNEKKYRHMTRGLNLLTSPFHLFIFKKTKK
ncbi:hypothetical protein HELRODRAFT_158849 [Helobdella robusta]|uniref:Uncharacterized protein n=1 Tax=Helobdella robusta TaxID=6412 RepID=T1ENC2_HELRO|nr:hypothetical protein HELRODRAFT_158849 [Helobdella robusta]ESO12344.1 hypothetical protein HELRODRAFT_158849 [Helobdella robusta]